MHGLFMIPSFDKYLDEHADFRMHAYLMHEKKTETGYLCGWFYCFFLLVGAALFLPALQATYWNRGHCSVCPCIWQHSHEQGMLANTQDCCLSLSKHALYLRDTELEVEGPLRLGIMRPVQPRTTPLPGTTFAGRCRSGAGVRQEVLYAPDGWMRRPGRLCTALPGTSPLSAVRVCWFVNGSSAEVFM